MLLYRSDEAEQLFLHGVPPFLREFVKLLNATPNPSTEEVSARVAQLGINFDTSVSDPHSELPQTEV